jgi:diguanylate cyclase (GGDEF)-like protein/PAS domain S-box-containing protein
MRIRSLLLAAIVAAALLGTLAAGVVAMAASLENAAAETQSRAQNVSHEVTGLLTLTQEYARYLEPRAAEQWHLRHASIAKALLLDDGTSQGNSAVVGLRSLAHDLPELFSRLQDIPKTNEPFDVRRREALLDQLLTSTQAMSDYADQWFQDVAVARHRAQERFQIVALAAPVVMLLMFMLLTWVVRRRLLLPVQRLAEAAALVGKGQLGHRIGNDTPDELGELARRFDAMTAAVSASRDQAAHAAKRLRAVTDNLPTFIAYIDTGERFRFANDQYRRLPDVDPAALIGKTVKEGLGDEAYAVIGPHLAATLAGERQQFERTSLVDGKPAWLLSEYLPDIDESGQVIGLYAMTVDVTVHREAGARLRDSETRLRAITDNIPALIGHFDRDERCLFANTTVRKLTGLVGADLSGQTLRSGIGEDIYALHEPHVQAALQGERRSFEWHMVRKGRDAYFIANIVPDSSADGSVCGFYVMSFDVTDVRQAEVSRARSEQRLRQITDNLPVLISYVDSELRLGFANATFKTWLGVDTEGMIGWPLRDVVGAEAFEARRQKLELALQGERVEFEGEVNGQGVTRATQTAYIPDRDASGAVQGVYALTSDVSSLKRVEQQLKALARFDTLTGLPNRLHYNEKLPEALARCARNGCGVALMFLDIDHFKAINDSLGHAAGDAVLKEFAKRLQKSVRGTDTVARLAGDEFVVILEGLHDATVVTLIADKIIAEMNAPFVVDQHILKVTTSVGISHHDASEGDITPGALLERADKALYEAKSAGRNVHRMA